MNNRRLSYLLLAVSLVMLLGVSGFGIAGAQSAATDVTITETEFKLDPASITVPVNTPVQVTVKNAGTVPHNLTFALPAQNIQHQLFAQNLNPGETRTATFTVTAAGQWTMFCPVDAHQAAGMKGTVMVVAASGAMSGAATGTASQANPAATATATAPRVLPKTGGETPVGALIAMGLLVLMAGLGLRLRRSA